ncbi:MAG: uroporphyrinogen-III decarboxylase [Promethearchaeota archaeon CR_4]|nr:MAG: uroporphyrinogen-III decarboxylase [Candidatus Lokiarchaeota archaeon CR_4]
MADDMGFKTDVIFPPKVLREKFFPWYQQIAQVTHKAGAKFIFHSCGNINAVLDDIVKKRIGCPPSF